MGTSNCSDEFKRDVVDPIPDCGYPVRGMSRRLGVNTHSIHKWVKLFGERASKTNIIDREGENRRLKREPARVTEKLDFLKKGNGVLRARVRMKYTFIRPHREEIQARAMCQVLRVHFSVFYEGLKEPLSHRAQEDTRQTDLIRKV